MSPLLKKPDLRNSEFSDVTPPHFVLECLSLCFSRSSLRTGVTFMAFSTGRPAQHMAPNKLNKLASKNEQQRHRS